MKEKMPQILAAIALVAALGASVMLVVIPVYSGTEIDPSTGQQIQTTATLIQVNGKGVLFALSIPVVIAAAGWLAILYVRRPKVLLVWGTAFLLTAFVFVTGFSIGMFYVPAMILLMTSAIVCQFRVNSGAR